MARKKSKRPKKEATDSFEVTLARDLRKIVWWGLISISVTGVCYLLVELIG